MKPKLARLALVISICFVFLASLILLTPLFAETTTPLSSLGNSHPKETGGFDFSSSSKSLSTPHAEPDEVVSYTILLQNTGEVVTQSFTLPG